MWKENVQGHVVISGCYQSLYVADNWNFDV